MTESVDGPAGPSAVRVLLVVIGVSLVLSALGGVLWGFLAPAEQLFVVAEDRGAALTGESLHRFDTVAVFSFIALTLGIVLPVAWWTWKSQRGPLLFLGVLVGALAGSGVQLLIGNVVTSLRFPRSDAPVVGEIVTLAPGVSTPLVLIVQALAASLVVLLLAAMNPNDDLRHANPEREEEDADASIPPPSFDSRLTD